MDPTLPMDVQLNVDRSAGSFADLTHGWLDDAAAALWPDVHAELLINSRRVPVTADELPPGTPYGQISLLPDLFGGRSTRRRAYGLAGLDWLRKQLRNGQPYRTDMLFARFGVRGQRLCLEARRDADVSPEWLTLSGYPIIADLLDPATGPAEQARWLEVLFAFADRTNPGYGHIGLYHDGGDTALEHSLPTTMPQVARSREHAVNECRRYLRGYSWVTIVARELLPRVGGLDRLRASGAFVQVRPLTAGGVWLQATDDYRAFDDEALTRVFEALAPALRPGMPRDLPPPMAGKNPSRVVLRDAAELGAA